MLSFTLRTNKERNAFVVALPAMVVEREIGEREQRENRELRRGSQQPSPRRQAQKALAMQHLPQATTSAGFSTTSLQSSESVPRKKRSSRPANDSRGDLGLLLLLTRHHDARGRVLAQVVRSDTVSLQRMRDLFKRASANVVRSKERGGRTISDQFIGPFPTTGIESSGQGWQEKTSPSALSCSTVAVCGSSPAATMTIEIALIRSPEVESCDSSTAFFSPLQSM